MTTQTPRLRASDSDEQGYARIALWVGAAVVIGRAVELGNGIYDSEGVWWLTSGVLLAWAGLLLPASWRTGQLVSAALGAAAFAGTLARASVYGFSSAQVAVTLGAAAFALGLLPALGKRRVSSRQIFWAACIAGTGFEAFQLFAGRPITEGALPSWFAPRVLPLFACIATAAWASGAGVRKALIPLMLVAHFAAGAWLLRRSPKPFIDVFVVTKASCEAMSRGVNPYSITFPDIYVGHPDWEKAFYPPGFVVNGRIDFGYQYTPLSFFVAYLGHIVGHDFRLGHRHFIVRHDFRLGNLLAITAAGGFMAYARRSRVAPAAAALFLLTPPVFHVAEYGWSEPVVVVCLAATVFCACRAPRLLPYAVGLLLVSKQHMALAAPAVLLLLPRPWRLKTAAPFLLKAAAVGAAATLPLMLWNFHAFWHSAVEVQLKNPFRSDSLNYAAAWVRAGHDRPPGWFEFAVAAAAAGAAVWRAPRTPAGFAAAVAVIYLSFFAVAKQAFCNYYFMIIGALCCAVAAWGCGQPAESERMPSAIPRGER